MIIDKVENIGKYAALGEHFRTAAEWLAGQDMSALAPGSIQVDGERVYATLADNRLSGETPAYEAHRRYADIQVIVDGKEKFFLGTEGTAGQLIPEKDFCPCEVSAGLPFVLESGWFVIFLPGEMHAPGNPAGEPSVCRKMVIKVRS